MAGGMLCDISKAKIRSSFWVCSATDWGSARVKIKSSKITVRQIITATRWSRKRSQSKGKASSSQKKTGFANCTLASISLISGTKLGWILDVDQVEALVDG